jgi:hypothetical protein
MVVCTLGGKLKMRKSLWMILALLLGAIVAPTIVKADTYTATFFCTGTCTSVPAPDTNVVFPTPTLFTVWNTIVFNGLLLINPSFNATDAYTWNATYSLPIPLGGDFYHAEFDITDTSITDCAVAGCNVIGEGIPLTTPVLGLSPFSDQGTLVFTLNPSTTPEAGTTTLTLSGLGLLGLLVVMRKL